MSTKILISGLPAAGKTTLLKSLEDVYIVAVDGKNYPFEQPHTNIESFENIDELLDLINEKVEVYKERFDKLPSTIVFDSASRILMLIVAACEKKFQGFNVWTEANKQIHKFVSFVNDIVNSDINVVLVSHAIWDQDTGRYAEVAQGNFGKVGGFLSTVDFASFIEIKGNKRIIHHRNPKLMARTLLDEVPDSQEIDKFNLNDYINLINEKNVKIETWSI